MELQQNPLAEAERLVLGERNRQYGHPYDDYTTTGIIWSALLAHATRAGVWKNGDPIPAWLACRMMEIVKIVRSCVSPTNFDHYVDSIGYGTCSWACIERAIENGEI